MDDGLEVLLQVDALGQAVRGDQDVPPRLAGELGDAVLPFGGWQLPVTAATRPLLPSCLCEVLGNVLGGRDEPAEDDRVIPIGQQPLDLLNHGGELLVVLLALKGLCLLRQRHEAALALSGR